MTKAHDAADAIKRMAKQYELMKFAAEALEQIGSLEQATSEAQAAATKAAGERDAALSERDAAVLAAQHAQAEATDIVQQSKFEAEVKAADILRSAEAAAETKLATAERNALEMIASASAQVDKMRAAASAIQIEIDKLRDDAQAAEAAAQAATEKANDAEMRLARTRSAIAKLAEV
jgi:hypothetical protein